MLAGEVERGVVRRQHHPEALIRKLGTEEVEDERPFQQRRVVYRVQVLNAHGVLGGKRLKDGVDAVLLRTRPRVVRAVRVEDEDVVAPMNRRPGTGDHRG
ncbi:MAG: hypothetical protein PHF56_05195 [Desulfuromonadaceae bacterium]|nr:hypothetical protein [Desulfuromonadaceae bacterium]